MADSLAEAAMNGCVVPSSRTELEKWMLNFRGVPVAAIWARAEMPSRCRIELEIVINFRHFDVNQTATCSATSVGTISAIGLNTNTSIIG